MNPFKQIIFSILSGYYSGKGNKETKKRNFTTALRQYKTALGYTDNEGSKAILLELISRSYANMQNTDASLEFANKSLKYYGKIAGYGEAGKQGLMRVTQLKELLERKENKELQIFLNQTK
jgi:hypothetical protein